MKKTILTIALTAAFSSFITVGVINQIGGLTVEQNTAVKEVDGKFKTLKGSTSWLGGELVQMDEAAVAKAAKKPSSKVTKKPSSKGDSTKELDNGSVFEWVDNYTGIHYLVYSLQRGEAGMGGITPRLNADQSVMTDDYAIPKKD